MITAAGILFLTPEKKALFLKRGPGGDFPGFWCFPGGKLEVGETLEQCAVREAKEELGNKAPSGDRYVWARQIRTKPVIDFTALPDVTENVTEALLPGEPPAGEVIDFTTYIQQVKEEFAVGVDGEHVGWAWAPIDEPPQPMHPGCEIALERFSLDELGIARAIQDKRLVSPQTYKNITLFDIRITGTGAAYRHKLDEFVWRDPSLYLNQEFLDRCAGLQVIMEHPDKSVLDSNEYKKRAIGSIMFAYIKGEEVWGIAKVYDDKAVAMMKSEQLSTSPSVVLKDPENSKAQLEDGEIILIEGKPTLLDHIAICEHGVWDKGGEPSGVSLTKGDDVMDEAEKKAAEERARADAEKRDKEETERWDVLMTGVKGINSRLDKQEERQDALDARVDSIVKPKSKARADDDMGKKCDDDNEKEEKKEKEKEEKVKPKEVAADKHKSKKADDDDDSKKKDAKKDDDDDSKKKDDDDDDAKAKMSKKDDDDSKSRKDSTDFQNRLSKVEAQIKPMTDADRRAVLLAQEKADPVFQAFGDSAPIPLAGEDAISYRQRIAAKLKVHSDHWKGVDLSAAFSDSAAFNIAEAQIYADATLAAKFPKDLPEFDLREVRRADGHSGHRISEFFGKHSFIHQLKPATGSSVTRFFTNREDRARDR